MTVVSDPAKALALAQELSVLLAKGAIEPVDQVYSIGGPRAKPGGIFTGPLSIMLKVIYFFYTFFILRFFSGPECLYSREGVKLRDRGKDIA